LPNLVMEPIRIAQPINSDLLLTFATLPWVLVIQQLHAAAMMQLAPIATSPITLFAKLMTSALLTLVAPIRSALALLLSVILDSVIKLLDHVLAVMEPILTPTAEPLCAEMELLSMARLATAIVHAV